MDFTTKEELYAHYLEVRRRLITGKSKNFPKFRPQTEDEIVEPAEKTLAEKLNEDFEAKVIEYRNSIKPGSVLWVIHDSARNWQVSIKDIRGNSRQEPFASVRREIAYRLKHECGLSLTAIARVLHRTDHTTALALINAYRRKVLNDPEAPPPKYQAPKSRRAVEPKPDGHRDCQGDGANEECGAGADFPAKV